MVCGIIVVVTVTLSTPVMCFVYYSLVCDASDHVLNKDVYNFLAWLAPYNLTMLL